jgi:DNA modification methylase
MQTIMIPVEQIHIGSRQRTEDAATEKHIVELARDIQENGLIHAPLVDANNELVAGFCRISAIKRIAVEYFYAGVKIAPGFVPVTITHMTDERDLFRVELHENLRRKNLSPIDEAKAVKRLHEFHVARSAAWTKEDTGRELDILRGELPRQQPARTGEIADALLLASFETDADVAKAGSRSEAVKIAKRKLEQNLTATLGSFLAAADNSSEHTIIQGDCREVMKTLPEGEFAGIICDPPYGIDADSFGEQTMKGGHTYEDTKELAHDIVSHIFTLGPRICSETAHVYIFCDLRYFADFRRMGEEAGWRVFNTPLIWHKPNLGHAPWPGFFGRRYECILFACRGARALQKSRSDVFDFAADTNKVHAAQKPVALLEELLSLSFFPGEKVLDVCAGSGSIFRAAKATGMVVTGIELDAKHVDYCRAAIAED